tara:strand:- start:15 stop:254 length:240 start_codon:yes stop_codon:yes gene_type:complete
MDDNKKEIIKGKTFPFEGILKGEFEKFQIIAMLKHMILTQHNQMNSIEMQLLGHEINIVKYSFDKTPYGFNVNAIWEVI